MNEYFFPHFFELLKNKLMLYYKNFQYVKVKKMFEILFDKIKRIEPKEDNDINSFKKLLKEFQHEYRNLFLNEIKSIKDLNFWIEKVKKKNIFAQIFSNDELVNIENQLRKNWKEINDREDLKPILSHQNICPYCKKNLKENETVCTYCGVKVR